MTTESPKSLEQRLISIEERVMYAEQLLERLNDVLCDVQNRMDEQTLTLKRLTDSVERAAAGTVEPRTPEEERPPHY